MSDSRGEGRRRRARGATARCVPRGCPGRPCAGRAPGRRRARRRGRAARAARCSWRSTARCRGPSSSSATASAGSWAPSRSIRLAGDPLASSLSVAIRRVVSPSPSSSAASSSAAVGNRCSPSAVRATGRGDDPAEQGAGARDGDLLAHHRAHRELEPVEGARHPQAGPCRDERGERGRGPARRRWRPGRRPDRGAGGSARRCGRAAGCRPRSRRAPRWPRCGVRVIVPPGTTRL